MGLAMLRGYTHVETRSVRLAAGWYYLHIGKKKLEDTIAAGPALIAATFLDAPEESDLPKSCIIGMIRLGKAVSAVDAAGMHPWALPSCGEYSIVVEQSVEFQAAV